MGEYSALVCSKSLEFNDALFLLHERGKAMQEAVPVGQGSMLAVLGLNVEEIKELIENTQPSGVAISSLLHYNDFTIKEIKDYLRKNNIMVST